MLPFSSKILALLLMGEISPTIRIICIIFMYYTHTTGVVGLVV